MTRSAGARDAASAASPSRHGTTRRRAALVRCTVAAATFWIAYDGGSYGVAQWSLAAIAFWWTIAAGVAFGVLPVHRPTRGAAAVLGAATAFAALTGISAAWSSGTEAPFQSMTRTFLYVAVLALAATASRDIALWADGIALAIVAVAALALTSRLAPGHFPSAAPSALLPDAHTRLMYPVGYWNALAVLAALGFPLLLRAATAPGPRAMRAVALVPLPLLASVVYLASSRTGALSVLVGVLLFLAAARRRWAAIVAAVAGVGAGAAAVAVVSSQRYLVDGPVGSAAAIAEGRRTAVAVVALGVAAGLVHALTIDSFERLRLPRRAAIVGAALAVAILASAVAAAHPIRRWQQFAATPEAFSANGYVQSHFLSTNGNWRWQFWRSAFDEFVAHPLAGGGAASFPSWWAERGRLVGFIGNAHSLYFETLAELGAVGLALLATVVVGGTALAWAASRRTHDDGEVAAAATAGFVAFAVAAGVDWIWQVPAVAVVGLALLGLALSARGAARRPLAPALRIAAAAVAGVVLLAQVDVYATDAAIGSSRAAVARHDLSRARADAAWARRLQPWAATPYLQLALVEELRGRFASARRWIDTARARQPDDWRLWTIAARIERKAGDAGAAAASSERARELAPRGNLGPAAP